MRLMGDPCLVLEMSLSRSYLQGIWHLRRCRNRRPFTAWKRQPRLARGSKIRSSSPTTTWDGNGAKGLPVHSRTDGCARIQLKIWILTVYALAMCTHYGE